MYIRAGTKAEEYGQEPLRKAAYKEQILYNTIMKTGDLTTENQYLNVAAKKKKQHFTAVFEQVDGWWIGYVEELPGANTQAKTLEEARENLKEAAQLILEANKELTRRETTNKKNQIIREEIAIVA
jgi:predicted RNase H-like HicB family nuclease